MQTGIIYRAFNKVSEKSYIGQTTRTLEQRRKEHYWKTIKANYKFGRALQKYKETDWEWTILAEVAIEELEEYEIFFIKDLDTFKNGYNTVNGESWKGEGSPRHNGTIYELWHPEHGEIRGTIAELKKISPSFSQLQKLIREEISHINGYFLPKNKEKHKDIFKKYNYYHPSHGIVNCTPLELFKSYRDYFNTKECQIYGLTSGTSKLHFGWCLAENKDCYEKLGNHSDTMTLTHLDYGTLTLRRSEFEEKFGLSPSCLTCLKKGIYKNVKGWTLPENKDIYKQAVDILTLTHPEFGTHTLTRKEFKEQFQLTAWALSVLVRKERLSCKQWTLVEDSFKNEKKD